MNRLYTSASRELRSMLLGIDLTSFSGEQAVEIETAARRIVTALNIGMNEWANTYLEEAYGTAARKTRTALEILGKKPDHLLLKTDRMFIEDTVELLVQRNSTIMESVRDFLALAVLGARKTRTAQIQAWSYQDAAEILDKAAELAVEEEKSRGWLAKEIIDHLKDLILDGEFIKINNKTWRMDTYSKLVSRTTLRTAQSKATEDLCSQHENDLVEITSHDTTCESEICQPYEGKVFSINGKTPGFPILDRWPPFHPNCEHSAHPTSLEALAVRKRYEQGAAPMGWTEASDVDGAEKWAIQNLVEEGGYADYHGLSTKAANTINEQMAAMIERFGIKPEYLGTHDGWLAYLRDALTEKQYKAMEDLGILVAPKDTWGYQQMAWAEGIGGVIFPEDKWSEENHMKTVLELTLNRAKGFSKSQTLASVIQHEYGHLLDNKKGNMAYSAVFEAYWNTLKTTGTIKEQISGYAAAASREYDSLGLKESFADAFANYLSGVYDAPEYERAKTVIEHVIGWALGGD